MIEKRNRFKTIYPDKYFADEDDLPAMEVYLRSINFITADEKVISATVPGAGNMNYVLRVKTDNRNFIIKQSRPWVEKYPSIDAPIERISIEAQYYNSIKGLSDIELHSPEIYHFDIDNFILLMEDLGSVKDYTYLYDADAVIADEDVVVLASYLSRLHSVNADGFPDNLAMRKLNHTHIFNYPFDSKNGLDLDDIQDGLNGLAINENTDPELLEIIASTGDIYLATDGKVLLHGDFYPGSWMKSQNLFVLDAEFGFVGPAEFDLGVFIAHMKMSFQVDDKVELFLKNYRQSESINHTLAYKFAGIEILRRLLGVAQLPLKLTIEQKAKLMSEAQGWILS